MKLHSTSKLLLLRSLLWSNVTPKVVNNNSNTLLLPHHCKSNFSTHQVLPPSKTRNVSYSLYDVISSENDRKASVVPILEKFLQQGHVIGPNHLQPLVNRLRSFKRFSQALQVSEWMKQKYSPAFTSEDTAIQLELIYKVNGLREAEKYFGNLPKASRTLLVYTTLLRCYASTKSLSKAEAVMQKMIQKGFANSFVPYNIMLKLYCSLKLYDKAERMIKESEKMGDSFKTSPYVTQLYGYSYLGKVKDMEAVLMKMEADPQYVMNYNDYLTAANGYLRADAVDKSLVMLRRAENKAKSGTKKQVYLQLLSQMALVNSREDVDRIWNLYKSSWRTYNKAYQQMVSSLVTLNDLQGAEKIVDEWANSFASGRLKPNGMVINPLVRGYCQKGELESAQALIDRIMGTGIKPLKSTWETLALGYYHHNRMDDAVNALWLGLMEDGTAKFYKPCLTACLNHLQMRGSPEELQEFTDLLKQNGHSAERLLSGSAENVQEQSDAEDFIKDDDGESQVIV